MAAPFTNGGSVWCVWGKEDGTPIGARIAAVCWEHQEEVERGGHTGRGLWELDRADVDQVAWSALQGPAVVACPSTSQQWEPLNFTNPPVPPSVDSPAEEASQLRQRDHEPYDLCCFYHRTPRVVWFDFLTKIFIHPK